MIYKNLIIFFLIGFFSDIFLNILSHNNFVPSLLYYFKTKNVIEAAVYAGLTVLSAIIPSIIINKILFNEYMPKKLNHIIIFIIVSFIIGYIYDIFIDKMNIFGDSLKPFYKTYGSGFFGGASIAFSIIVHYFITNLIKL
jgi:hypothetical protein